MDLGWIEFRREDVSLPSAPTVSILPTKNKYRRMYFRKRNDILIYSSTESFERTAGSIRLSKVLSWRKEDGLCFRVLTSDSKVIVFKAKSMIDRLNWFSALKHTKSVRLNENQEAKRPTLKMLSEMAKNIQFEPPVAPPITVALSSSSSPLLKSIESTPVPMVTPPPVPRLSNIPECIQQS